MTAPVQVLLAAGGGAGPVSFSVTLNDFRNGATSSATVNLQSDGTITVLGSSSTTSGAWFVPTTTGVGSAYWVKYTFNSGSPATSGPANGSVTALSSTVGWNWQQASVGAKSAQAKLEIFDNAAGTGTALGSCTFNVTVERGS